ncbi:DUF721 domain-containing protein [Puniceibacterium sp. IMCC21224]|uniref:DUF721 domain-containing protein n=1 Tax=Puniceibacterium sp. IMCC21224 TaxID=1618204 RepID=UPI00064DDE5D|nr:DciA family protein [Puniceibacterium sp. IMCC21224]KMK65586.1 hypothetical protein IMCC21224_11418 [Puniceibacterium sp. IMCC21224]
MAQRPYFKRPKGTGGFSRTSALLQGQIRKASETRGFAQSRLLTHWSEIAGEDVAAMSRPVEVSYSKGGFGATLVLLTTGANAPMLEMQKVKIRERVNAVYGYNAIARVRITQTAASGFSEGRVSFDHRPGRSGPTEPDAACVEQGHKVAAGVGDDSLRAALERLAANVISKSKGSA